MTVPALTTVAVVATDGVSRGGARSDARRELAKPIYHQHDDPLLLRALHWFDHELSRLLARTASHAPGGGVGIALAVGLVIVALAVLRYRLGPLRRTPSTSSTVLAGTTRSAAEHRAAARAAAERAAWATAVVEGMRAVAREAEERGLVDVRPGRTARELASDCAAASPSLRAPLAAAATAFDEVAYGGRPGDEAAWGVVDAADEAVRRSSGAPATRDAARVLVPPA